MFDRLQSLLVDENTAEFEKSVKGLNFNVETSKKDNFNDCNANEKGTPFLETNKMYDNFVDRPNTFITGEIPYHQEETFQSSEEILDVSALSLDQRTYLQLRAIQLIDQPFLPSTKPFVIEEPDLPSSDESEKDSVNGQEEDDDLEAVIRRMQIDLSRMHRSNNSKLAYLQAAALSDIAESQRKKNDQDKRSKLFSSYMNLLNKQKETKKSKKKEYNKMASLVALKFVNSIISTDDLIFP